MPGAATARAWSSSSIPRITRPPAVFANAATSAADVLGDVAGAEEHVLLGAIEAGLLTGLVTEPGPGRIRFAHVLVRDSLYHGLSRLRRSRLHARAGEAIERHSPGQVAALAYHFAEAGTDPIKAARYCRLAARQASSASPTMRPPGCGSRPSPASTTPTRPH